MFDAVIYNSPINCLETHAIGLVKSTKVFIGPRTIIAVNPVSANELIPSVSLGTSARNGASKDA